MPRRATVVSLSCTMKRKMGMMGVLGSASKGGWVKEGV